MYLYELLELTPPPASSTTNQMYGIEVEMENCGRSAAESLPSELRVVPDGSLRNNGMEFLTPPIALDGAVRLMRDLYEVAARRKWRGSVRTGIHVHADMSYRTLDELWTIVATYLCLEPVLFSYAGEGRSQCTYCVPIYAAEGDMKDAVLRIRARPTSLNLNRSIRETCKYAALYLEPLRRFNTIEFRAAKTFDTVGELETWLRVVDCVVGSYGTFASAEDAIGAFEDDQDATAERILGPLYVQQNHSALIDSEDSIGVASRVCGRPVRDWTMPMTAPQVTEEARMFWRQMAPRRYTIHTIEQELDNQIDEGEEEF